MKVLAACLLMLTTALHGQVTFVTATQQETSDSDADLINFQLVFEIADSYYIQSDQPLEDNLIPATINFDESGNYVVEKVLFSEGLLKDGWTENQVISVFEDTFEVEVWLDQIAEVRQPITLTGELHFQPCDKKKCYFPKICAFEVEVR